MYPLRSNILSWRTMTDGEKSTFPYDKPTSWRHSPRMRSSANKVDAFLPCRTSRGAHCQLDGRPSISLMVWCRRNDTLPTFHPEFGRFMLEATPGTPWGIGFKDLLNVEPNMRWRSVTLNASCLPLLTSCDTADD